MSVEARYRRLVRRAAADPNVVGVVLLGSRAAGERITPTSDYDVYVITSQPTRRYRFARGEPIETVPMTLAAFRGYALPGSGYEAEWDRAAFIHARVELDRLDGEIGRLVDEKARLGPDEARSTAAQALDDYINFLYRSLKSWAADHALEARFDAAESIPYLLTTLFAFERRVRPFNKWLVLELGRAPLPIDGLLEQIDVVLHTGDPATQRALFQAVERLARERGHGAVIDGWEPDVAFLRGSAEAGAGQK